MTHDVIVPMDNATQPSNILIVDDDQELGEMLKDFLAPDHLNITACLSGEDGLETLNTGNFELLILDIMLPGMSGLDVLKKLRQRSDLPVIMLTARGDDIDRIIGLEFGADDYLAKPFNPRELAARIKAILRRAKQSPQRSDQRELGDIALDPRTRRATVNGEPLRLTGTEFEILRCLLETPGEVVSKDQLNQRALGRRFMPYDRSIDTHISNLRGKLEQAGAVNETIQNQRGVGYLLIPGK
jgi:two-component system response regulator CpxR